MKTILKTITLSIELTVVALAAELTQSGLANENLVLNGGFETGDATAWTSVPAANGSIYFIASGGPQGYGPEVDAHGGSYLAIYGANQGLNDTFSQTLPTVNGISYRFSFWLNNLDGQNASYFDVSWGNRPVVHIDETSPIFGWTEFSFIETATGPTTISFAGRNAPSFIALDDVSVTQYDDTVPPIIQCLGDMRIQTAPGSCGAIANFKPSASDDSGRVTVSCSPPSGSVFPSGTTTVQCTATDPAGNTAHCSFSVTVVDVEKPVASCIPTTNPSGGNVPSGNSKSGQNSDGFYQLLAVDNCDSHPALFVADSGSGFVAGPFNSGDKVKLIQAPGVTPNTRPMAGDIVAQIQLKGDALIYAVDASGNISARISCLLSHNSK